MIPCMECAPEIPIHFELQMSPIFSTYIKTLTPQHTDVFPGRLYSYARPSHRINSQHLKNRQLPWSLSFNICVGLYGHVWGRVLAGCPTSCIVFASSTYQSGVKM
jgi:hypothetical protein